MMMFFKLLVNVHVTFAYVDFINHLETISMNMHNNRINEHASRPSSDQINLT